MSEDAKEEMWGTYSVRDHTFDRPFVTDVLLYDKLVVPVPPPRESPEHKAEWERWEQAGWNPALQQQLLSVLGERVLAVPWDAQLQARYAERREEERRTAQQLADAFFDTASDLISVLYRTGQLPTYAGVINAVPTYRRLADLERAIGLQKLTEATKLPAGGAVAIIGRELLVPDSEHYRSDGDLLKAAIDLSAVTGKRRQAYWDWQRRFFREDQTDYRSIQRSVERMADMLADERRDLRREKSRLTTIFVLTIVGAGLTVAANPIGLFVLGGAFVSLAQFGATELMARRPKPESPSAIFYDARRHLGWK
jgi:hypothetical protein